MIDVNVTLSHWPFRRLAFDETPQLVRKLRENGFARAWAGSFDALLHRDIAGVNLRLAEDCKRHGQGLLLPVGAINPALPDWQDDLRRCHEEHGMRVIRLHPDYHGYTLDSDECHAVCESAAERGLIVQLALRMDDPRISHPLVQVPVTLPSAFKGRPVEALLQRHSELRLIVMNNYGSIRHDVAARLAKTGHVYFEISHAEQVGTLEKLVAEIPLDRILLGSHFPLFNLEAATLKFQESKLTAAQTAAIQHGNADALMAYANRP